MASGLRLWPLAYGLWDSPSRHTGTTTPVTIGTSILLIAIGAILRYAVNVHSSAFNISTAGLILMIVGILGLILSLLYTAFWADRTRPRRDPYLDEPPTRRY
jgi:hypothetical protein